MLALTECEPARRNSTIRIGPTTGARAAVLADIRANGSPLLAALFAKGALDIGAWVCCTADEVVLMARLAPRKSPKWRTWPSCGACRAP